MKLINLAILVLGTLTGCNMVTTNMPEQHVKNDLRAPAYPLITIDPYTSAWSMIDKLYDAPVKHWTGKDFPLIGVVKVDDAIYRFMGDDEAQYDVIAGTASESGWKGKYTLTQPSDGWEKPDFKDDSWKISDAAFGTDNEATAKTAWNSEWIWVRREIELTGDYKGKQVYLNYSHDDDAVIYVNGVKVVDTGNNAKSGEQQKLTQEALATLHEGKNIIAASCRNRVGGGLIDFGMSVERDRTNTFVQTARQTNVDVQATQTYYDFTCGPVDLRLTFTAPAFVNDLELVSRPVNYLTYSVNANDGKKHDIQVYFEAGKQWAVDLPTQATVSKSGEEGNLVYVSTGSKDQKILGKKGDNVRIDWGYFYMAAPKANAKVATGDPKVLRDNFVKGKDFQSTPTTDSDKLAIVSSLGKTKAADGHVLFAYDDVYSIQYFEENLRPYWNRNNDQTIFTQMSKAEKDYDALMEQAIEWDRMIYSDAEKVGGKKYAELCATAYRQVMNAHKLVQSPNGDLLWLSKECFSNGSINTVDLTYPSAPMFLVYNLELEKGMMNGIFYYSESGKWEKPFSAHDIGTYPLANGQTYGGDMPVEESGNMLILAAAIATVENNADYAKKHWETLTIWADYLIDKGLDPENQLCTDDFAGHLAHNANLSVKAIMGVASYGYLAEMLGQKDIAKKYMDKAKEMASQWPGMAEENDHYKLAFDQSDTWSMKYNLVWGQLLKFNLFPKEVGQKELKYYMTKINKYGLPLDCRETYTKSDWILWTAAMAEDKDTFNKLVDPVWQFMNDTQNRVPMSDWSWTLTPEQRGFQNRSVIGGYWMPILKEKLLK
ncbi:MAG: glutaminase domain-containing protein [Phocaeicola sp.]|uniref:glutaminase family protein n=1 Tax=Phocaeicola sp. TaxID=2773926 RepID=UPI003FA0C825